MKLAATLARSLQADIHAELLARGLTQCTGGERECELDADNIRQLLRALEERYPSLEPHLKDSVAVAIDGEIFQDAWLEPIPPESEVHIIPQIVGG
jgi:molybdopterin converting factor small subunit